MAQGAVDRGGLQYAIDVEDAFSSTFNEFEADVESATQAWQEFKAVISSSAASAATKSFQSLSKAVKDVAASFEGINSSINDVVAAEALLVATNEALIAQKQALVDVNAATAGNIDAIKQETAAVASLAQAYQRLAAAKSRAGGNVSPGAAGVAAAAGVSGAAGPLAATGAGPLASGDIQGATESFGALSEQVVEVGGNVARTTSEFEQLFALYNEILAFRRKNNLPFSGQGGDLKNVTDIDGEARLLTVEEQQNAALATQTQQVQRLTTAYKQLGTAQNGTGGGAAGGGKGGGGGGPGVIPGGQFGGPNGFQGLQTVVNGLNSIQTALKGVGGFLDSITPKLNGFIVAFLEVQAIRGVISVVSQLINGMIDFNAEVEKSQLSMAALFLAAGDVRDALGETVSPAQGLAIAQQEALKQTQLLRQEALSTTSTFEALLKTFQVSIAPGLNAGLNVDQIRKFSVAITQAAGVIGVADNQIAHEVRDILAGTINNSRGDRIAKALGIDNQSIENAKTQGRLVEFLTDKFKAFSVAGQASLGTFDTILKNVKAALDQVIGSGGLDFFNKVKASLQEIFGFLTSKDSINNVLTPSPEAVAIIKTIADGLSLALDTLTELVKGFGQDGLLKAAQVVSEAIQIIAKVVKGIVEGIIQALPTLEKIATGIVNTIKSATGFDLFDTTNLDKTVASITKIGVVFLATLGSAKLFLSVTESITGAFSDVLKFLKKIGVDGAAVFGTLGALGVSVGALFGKIGLDFTTQFGKAQNVVDQVTGGLRDVFSGAIAPAVKESAKDVNDLGKRLESLPGVIQATAEHAKDFDKTIEAITKDIRDTTIELQQQSQLLGATGPVLQERNDLFKAEVAAREKIQPILGEEKQAQQTLLGIQQQQRDVQAKIAEQSKLNQEVIAKGVESGSAYVQDQRELALVQQKIAEQTAEINTARIEGNKQDESTLFASLKNLEEERAALVAKSAEDLKKAATSTNDEELTVKKRKELNDLIVASISLRGQEAAQQEKKNQLAQDELTVTAGLTAAAANRLAITAQQSAFETTQQQGVLQAQAAAAAATFASRNLLTDQKNLVTAQNTLTLLQAQVDAERAKRDIQIQQLHILETQLEVQAKLLHAAATKDGVDPKQQTALFADEKANLDAIAAVHAQIGALESQNLIKTQLENTELAKATDELTHQELIASQPFAQGLIDGFKEAAQQIPGLYKGIVDLVKGTITSFTNFVSESIVDAFDPTKDGTLQQRFAEFLQGIAKQVLNLFFELAIQKAILGLGFLGSGGPTGFASSLGGLGFAEGGEIPARGYATGGTIRPRGLDPRDTIPIWAQAGEFMQPLHSVKKLGLDFMERLRSGAVNAAALRAAAGLSPIAGSTISRGNSTRGFAGGGQISAAAGGGSGASAQQAIIVSSDDNVERFLAGGKNALFRALESDKKRLRAIIQ